MRLTEVKDRGVSVLIPRDLATVIKQSAEAERRNFTKQVHVLLERALAREEGKDKTP